MYSYLATMHVVCVTKFPILVDDLKCQTKLKNLTKWNLRVGRVYNLIRSVL